jgi:hypothetical protein
MNIMHSRIIRPSIHLTELAHSLARGHPVLHAEVAAAVQAWQLLHKTARRRARSGRGAPARAEPDS